MGQTLVRRRAGYDALEQIVESNTKMRVKMGIDTCYLFMYNSIRV